MTDNVMRWSNERVSPAMNRFAAAAGVIAVAGNVLAVVLLNKMPSAYRLAQLDAWVAAVQQQHTAASASAIAFTVGLIALAGWAVWLGSSLTTSAAKWGAGLIAVTALFNALGTTTPLVLAVHVGACGAACDAVGRAMLGLTLSLDSLFNLGLGVGLLLIAIGAPTTPRWLRGLMVLAGAASLPVAAQALWDPAATVLFVAAPLWLALILVTCLKQRTVSGERPSRSTT